MCIPSNTTFYFKSFQSFTLYMNIYVGFHHCNPCHSVLHTVLLVQLSPFITVANISPDKGTSPMRSSSWTKDYFSCAIFVDYVLNDIVYAITVDLNMVFRCLLFLIRRCVLCLIAIIFEWAMSARAGGRYFIYIRFVII